jgi:hydrogenase nickel incorporation protein HypA/HybF
MHELSIAVAILDEVGDVAARQNIARVRGVRLQVGELSSVVGAALRFAWELASEGTVAQGSRLDIERIAVQVYCPQCRDNRTPIAANHLICAQCGAPAPDIARGRELLVVGMEVEDVDPRAGSPTVDPQEELDAGARAARAL